MRPDRILVREVRQEECLDSRVAPRGRAATDVLERCQVGRGTASTRGLRLHDPGCGQALRGEPGSDGLWGRRCGRQ